MTAWSYIGQYFADKWRAGVELAKYDSGIVSDRSQALANITSAKAHWESLISVTESRYKAIPLPHLYGDIFSWKQFLSEVEWDIAFVEEYTRGDRLMAVSLPARSDERTPSRLQFRGQSHWCSCRIRNFVIRDVLLLERNECFRIIGPRV